MTKHTRCVYNVQQLKWKSLWAISNLISTSKQSNHQWEITVSVTIFRTNFLAFSLNKTFLPLQFFVDKMKKNKHLICNLFVQGGTKSLRSFLSYLSSHIAHITWERHKESLFPGQSYTEVSQQNSTFSSTSSLVLKSWCSKVMFCLKFRESDELLYDVREEYSPLSWAHSIIHFEKDVRLLCLWK